MELVALRARGAFVLVAREPGLVLSLGSTLELVEPNVSSAQTINHCIRGGKITPSQEIKFIPSQTLCIQLITFFDASLSFGPDNCSHLSYVRMLAADDSRTIILNYSILNCESEKKSALANKLFAAAHVLIF